MLKAYKYRIYPTKEQEEYFAKIFGCVRFILDKLVQTYLKPNGDAKKAMDEMPSALVKHT